MIGAYTDVLRLPGAAKFVTAGFVGRLPISMVSLGVVLLVTANGGDYAQAGALSASYALAAAVFGPIGARFIDRHGQARVAPLLLAAQLLSLAGFIIAASTAAATWLQFGLLIVAGGAAPNIGSLVRARWAARLAGDDALKTAFAVEAIVDELVFVIGPPLVTLVALGFGEPAALALCAMLFATGTLWLVSQRTSEPQPRPRPAGGDHPRLLSVGLVVVLIVMIMMGMVFGSFEVTTVAAARSFEQEPLTGVILALYAVGSMVAGLWFGTRTLAGGLTRPWLATTSLLAVVCLPLPFVTGAALLAAAAVLAGAAVSPVLILAAGLVEQLVDPARLTEAFTVTTSGIAVGLAIGATGSGVLIDSRGAAAGYLVTAAGGLAAAAVAWATVPALRGPRSGDTRPRSEPPGEPA